MLWAFTSTSTCLLISSSPSSTGNMSFSKIVCGIVVLAWPRYWKDYVLIPTGPTNVLCRCLFRSRAWLVRGGRHGCSRCAFTNRRTARSNSSSSSSSSLLLLIGDGGRGGFVTCEDLIWGTRALSAAVISREGLTSLVVHLRRVAGPQIPRFSVRKVTRAKYAAERRDCWGGALEQLLRGA